MDIGYHGSRFVYSLIGAGISIIIVCAIIIISSRAINPDSKTAADPSFAVASNNRNNPLTLTKGAVYDHNSITVASISSSSSSSADDGSQIITMIHPISFAEDTLFPQSFVSNPSGSDITLSNGTTLADRPITLAVNKIQSNNTLTLLLHSLNDKYLLTGELKGPAKLLANSTADNAQFSVKGNIDLNKNTHYSVVGSLAESKNKGLTLTINDAKNPNNFKATIGFSPPHSEGPLAE
jgi:hypothetical protein